MSDTTARLAAVLRDQEASCAEMGSPLYAGVECARVNAARPGSR